METNAVLAFAICSGFMVVANLIGNSLVCAVILKVKSMRTPANYLLLNLAIADLSLGIFTIPFGVLRPLYNHPSGMDGELFCKFVSSGNVMYIFGDISSFTLVAVAYERYQAVFYPLLVKQRITKKKTILFIIAVWIGSISLTSPWFIWTGIDESTGLECITKRSFKDIRNVYGMVHYTFLVYSVPFILMIFFYGRVIWKLVIRQDRVLNREQPAATRVKKRIVTMLITVTAIFTVCWGTQTVLYRTNIDYVAGDLVTSITALLLSVNSSVNALLYVLFSQQFREGFKRICSCIHRSQNRVTIGPYRIDSSTKRGRVVSLKVYDTKL